ncbi:MAG: hypothetical protein GXY19_17080 [Phycisphaerae bacterium]|nr:hypothetical protein [Phycisphaerae bacterium]
MKPRWAKAVFVFVLLSLILSCIYAIVGVAFAPGAPVSDVEHEKIKSDYALMLVQCLLGIGVMFLPSALERRLRIAIPGFMYALFIVFLYAAIYLGEVRSFYYRIPHWDLILHGFSGLMLGALSFSVIVLLNNAEKIRVSLSPAFVAVFAFCFALAMGVVWEFYEFFLDGLLGLNMQKFALENGQSLVGRDALVNTMNDLVVDAIGALVMSAIGYISAKYGKGWIAKMLMRRTAPVT